MQSQVAIYHFGCTGNFSITLGSQVDEGAFREQRGARRSQDEAVQQQ